MDRALLSLVFLVLGLLAFRQIGSLDVGFHLKAGEYILSNGGWPTHDPFTYTLADHEYVDTSWGYQVLIAVVHRVAGPRGLVLLHTALVLGIFFVLYRTARLVPADPASLGALLLVGGLACEMRFETRPEIVSYFLLAVVLHVLHRHAEGRASPLWTLPVVHLVWANTHSLFVLGWAALACFGIGLWWKRGSPDRRLLAWSTLCLPAALINPYGWRGVLFPFKLATRFQGSNVFAQAIGEFASPFALNLSERFPFYPRVPIVSFRAFLVLSFLGALVALRRKRYWCTLLWLAFVPLSYRMMRNLPILVVVALPATVWALPLQTILERLGVGKDRGRTTAWLARAVLALAAAVIGLRVVSDAYYVASRREDRFGWTWNRLALPVDTAEFLRRSAFEGRVLNHLNLGGYLMWATDRPVFIDGRLEVVGEEFFADYVKALESEEALEACVARYGIRWLIFPYANSPQLLGRVSRDGRWRLAHVDPVAAVFVRDGPGVETLLDPDLGRGSPSPLPIRSLPALGAARGKGGCRTGSAGSCAGTNSPGTI